MSCMGFYLLIRSSYYFSITISKYALFVLQVFIAILVDNFLYTISAIRSHFSQSINWSGIRYYLKDGKINKVSWPRSSIYEKIKEISS